MIIVDDKHMRDFGAKLIDACQSGGVIALSGDLGTGKTTLVRGALESKGVTSGVRSPTYTLVEYYEFNSLTIAHFDLYRLGDPEELEYLGFRDYLTDQTVCLIEWPEKAEGYLNQAGLLIQLNYHPEGRRCEIKATNEWGQQIISRLN